MAPYMVRPDHPWRRTWSGGDTIWQKGTIHGAVDGPAGPTVGGNIYGMTVLQGCSCSTCKGHLKLTYLSSKCDPLFELYLLVFTPLYGYNISGI